MGLSIAELEILLKARDEASAVVAKAEKNIAGYSQSLERLMRPALLATAAAATILSGATFLAARAAIEDQAATAALSAAINATGEAFTGANEEGVMAFVRSLENFSGFSKVEVMQSLQLLTEETGNVEEAMKRELIAVDFARGAHLDLWSASKLLGKVTDDTINVLARYGIHVDKGTTATELFALVQQKFAGQAEAFAGTVEGKWEKLKNRVHDLEAEIGAALLPTFQKMLDAADAFIVNDLPKIIQGVTDFTAKHPDILAFGLAILGVVAALAAVGTVVGPIAAALGLILSPIGLAVLAVTGLFIAWQTNFLGIQQITKDFVLGLYKSVDDIGEGFNQFGTAIHKVLDDVGAAIGQWVRERIIDVTQLILKIREAAGLPLPSGDGSGGNRQTGGDQDGGGHGNQTGSPKATLDDIYAAYNDFYGHQPDIGFAQQVLAAGLTYAQVRRAASTGQFFMGTTQGVIVNTPNTPSLQAAGNAPDRADRIPSFGGGGLMDHDGLAYLHAGETVLTPGQGGGGDIIFNGPVYGVDNLREMIVSAVREVKERGGYRGVLAGR